MLGPGDDLSTITDTEVALVEAPGREQPAAGSRRLWQISAAVSIPLVATWSEKTFSSELNKAIDFCHTFFGMEDGGALALSRFPDPEMYALTQTDKPPKMARQYHIAFKAEPDTYEELKRRLEAAEEPCRESNHGY